MSFKAVFNVDGKDYNVLSSSFRMHQDIDATGRPSSIARGGVVKLLVESTDGSGLLQWMCDSYMKKDAKITFNKREENAKLKELEIKEAYLVDYEEIFDSAGSSAMTEAITLSAKSIKIGDGEHTNEWPI